MAAIHHTNAHRRAAAALRAQRLQPCVLCGEPINYEAAYPDPDSFSADHWPPVSEAGDHHHLEPAHLGCQRQQGGTIRADHTEWDLPPIRTSGTW